MLNIVKYWQNAAELWQDLNIDLTTSASNQTLWPLPAAPVVHPCLEEEERLGWAIFELLLVEASIFLISKDW